MGYLLRHRHSYDPLSITHCLSLKAPRLTTPPQWHWAWPLHTAASPSSSSLSVASPSPSSPSPTSASSLVRHVWVSAIRSLTVSDDASFLAFVSQHGAVALCRPSTDYPPTSVHAPPHHFPDAGSLDWCRIATCVAFFQLTPSPSSPTRHILAVGYASGAIALFDSATVRLLSVSKLPSSAPVRRLRFYTTLHAHHSMYNNNDGKSSNKRSYNHAAASRNSGLLATVGWAGMVAFLSTDEMLSLILKPAVVPDAYGAGWLTWNLSAQDAVLDAAACGSAENSIYQPDKTPDPASSAIRIVTVGINAPIVIYHASPTPPFSARAAAARVATSFMSAARGFLLSRLSTEPEASAAESDSATKDPLLSSEQSSTMSYAVTGASSSIFTWVDDPVSDASMFKLGDSRASSVRKALSNNFQAGLKKRRPRANGTLLNIAQSHMQASKTTTRSSSAPYASKAISSAARATAAANVAAATGKGAGNHNHATITDADVVRRVHSSMAREDIAALLVRYTRNMRVVERIVPAPAPCGLVASSDTLGRIFIQDVQDFCVLRVLKGYRDANIAWLVQDDGVHLLVVHAPRLDVVELHGPLEQKRREAFRVLPGTIMVQTTSHRPYCVFPDGRIFEVHATAQSSTSISSPSTTLTKRLPQSKESAVDSVDSIVPSLRKSLLVPEMEGGEQAPRNELTGAFLEAVKSGRARRAVECLDKVADDSHKVAYLMATLITCASHVRIDVHMALASKAGLIAAELQNPDLVCRFEAHRRLAEAFQVVEAAPILVETSADHLRTSSRHGRRLIEDQLGFALAELGMEELSNGWKSTWYIPGRGGSSGRNSKSGKMTNPPSDGNGRTAEEQNSVNCEQFILSHCLVPTVDLEVESEYEILPRSDLSERERIWLAMVYFGKLLESDSTNNMNMPIEGREHPSTSEIFSALAHYVGLTEAEITQQFVAFFLHAPLVPLLNTYVERYASALQCTISRIRTRFTSDVVDPIVLDACETTNRVANAVLLVRLCATHGEDDFIDESWRFNVVADEDRLTLNPYVEALDRLNEALAFHRLVIGSTVTQETRDLYTARRFSGCRGDGEKMAILELLNVDDFSRVIGFFEGRASGIRRINELKLAEAADITSTALESCRIKTASILSETFYRSNVNGKNGPQNDNGVQIIPQYVMSWIFRPAEQDYEKQRSSAKDREETNFDLKIHRLSDMHSVLLSAHAYMLDSSEETVRCLQLADAISALIKVERRRKVSNDNTKGLKGAKTSVSDNSEVSH